MEVGSLLTTGALLGAGGGILYSLKSLPMMLYRRIKKKFLYSVRIYQHDPLFDILETWFSKHYKNQYKDVEGSVYYVSVPNEPSVPKIAYKQEENTFILKYKGKRVLVTKAKEKLDKAQNLKDLYFAKYLLVGWRAKRQISELIEEAVKDSIIPVETNIVKIKNHTIYGDWNSPIRVRGKSIDKVILEDDKRNKIIEDTDNFIKSEDWYIETGIPYKRGFCLYGPPGTGKTTLALALAQHLKKVVHCLNLSSLQDDLKLFNAFQNMEEGAILLIEDIDKVFVGRDSVNTGNKITFSALLNCLDGAFYKHGTIVIITTNHIEKLDEALLRTGRMDMKIRIPKPTDKQISEYLTIFYGKPMEVCGKFSITMSDVQGICLSNKGNPEKAREQLYETILVNELTEKIGVN